MHNTSMFTSEQAITAIEHSSKPTTELLVDAAAIVGFDLSNSTNKKASSNRPLTLASDGARFREQWILRWLIKKLSQSGDNKQTSAPQHIDLLTNLKTWSLLSHLLSAIPRQLSRDIVVERGFCRIFGECLAVVNKHEQEKLPVIEANAALGHTETESNRPTKRRKLSQQSTTPTHQSTHSESSLPASLLHVADQIAELLVFGQSSNQSQNIQVPADWIDGLNAAAVFLSRLISTTNLALSNACKPSQGVESQPVDPSSTLGKWVELWQAHTADAHNPRSQDSHSAFNENVLISALDFLSNQTAHSTTTTTSQALQRQIAIHCILPARSLFQRRLATSWKSWKTEPAVEVVQSIVQTLSASMGSAAASFGVDQGEDRAVILLRIASRLIPRSDIIKRKAESSWIEALFLCLSCMLSSTPKSPDSSENSMQTTSNKLSDGEGHPRIMYTSSKLLDAMQESGIEPSSHFWQFCVRQSVSATRQQLPITTLAKLVNLNASVFVIDDQHTNSNLLDILSERLSMALDSVQSSLQVVFDDILAPVLEEFGRTRRVNSFITFWKPKLAESFYNRATANVDDSSLQIWDHPDLLKHFSSVCQRYAQPSLHADHWKMVTSDLATLVEIVGPTHEIFAGITILINLLKPLERSQAVEKAQEDHIGSASEAVSKALRRATDYQGHRWRLWRLLEQLILLSPTALNQEALQILKIPWPSLTSTKHTASDPNSKHSCWQYMERYHYFCAILSFNEVGGVDSETIFDRVISWMNDLVQSCSKQTSTPRITSSAWDGLPHTMDSDDKVLSACLARLAASSVSFTFAQAETDAFLTNLTILTVQKGSTGVSGLAVVAEALLAKVVTSIPTGLVNVYTELMKQNMLTGSLPQLLQSLSQDVATRDQVLALIQAVCKNMQESSLLSEETFLDYLSLLAKVVTRHPALAADTLDLKLYAKLLERNTDGATLEQLLVAQQCVQQIIHSIIILPDSGTERSDASDSPVAVALKWTKKRLEKVNSSGQSRLLDQYTGYLVLAILRFIRDFEDENISKSIRKPIEKIKTYQDTVILKQCSMCLSGAPGTTQLYSVFVLLDCLRLPFTDHSLNTALQTCLQKLVQAILGLDARSSENVMSKQEVNVIAELWQLLSRHVVQEKSESASDFPLTKFTEDLNQTQCISSLRLQAQLASRYASQASLQALGSLVTSTNGTDQALTADTNFEMYLSLAAKTKKVSYGSVSDNDQIIDVLSRVASLTNMLKESSPPTLLIRLELSKLVFERHPLVINQYVIDTALMSIALLASQACHIHIDMEMTQVRPEHVFDRLCTILSTLIVRHRRRLTGRHHLLLPVLQNLLKCLFYPPTRKHLTTSPASKVAYLASLPQWLNPPNYTSTATLPQTSAMRLSRVLQQLCDPSSSSARHVSKNSQSSNNNLVDETKAIRRQVSQHTQYLLQTYCQVMLDGYIAPDVKEKLQPGLYAVMNATDVEVMRGLNAAMDANQRAIWKDLYSDWKTYGKWNQR